MIAKIVSSPMCLCSMMTYIYRMRATVVCNLIVEKMSPDSTKSQFIRSQEYTLKTAQVHHVVFRPSRFLDAACSAAVGRLLGLNCRSLVLALSSAALHVLLEGLRRRNVGLLRLRVVGVQLGRLWIARVSLGVCNI